MNFDVCKKYSPLLLRTGIAIVFLWFGFSQLKNPASWIRLLPAMTKTWAMSGTTLIYINGTLEIIFAIALLLGLYTRFVAAVLTLHLLHITTLLGYGAVAVRDFSLAVATASIFLHGADEFCFDTLLKKKKAKSTEK